MTNHRSDAIYPSCSALKPNARKTAVGSRNRRPCRGVLSYGATDTEARSKATALALRVVAERVENGEPLPGDLAGMFQLA